MLLNVFKKGLINTGSYRVMGRAQLAMKGELKIFPIACVEVHDKLHLGSRYVVAAQDQVLEISKKKKKKKYQK